MAIRDIQGVLTVFQRYTDGDLWKVGMGGAGTLSVLMQKLHDDLHNANGHIGNRFWACPTCPIGLSSGSDVNYKILGDILSGRDPLFRIAQELQPEVEPTLRSRLPVAKSEEATEARGPNYLAAIAVAISALALTLFTSYYDSANS